MVVDDEDVLVEMIAALIEDLGYRAIIATNGREALAALEAEPEPPLLVISDVMMPQMNGVALAQAIKTNPRFQRVPVALMSAAIRPPANCIADHFIHKPFDLDRIERLIEQYNGHA
ncbi:MAG TPA: response regulator [Herpetosiphonaceae bacterium]